MRISLMLACTAAIALFPLTAAAGERAPHGPTTIVQSHADGTHTVEQVRQQQSYGDRWGQTFSERPLVVLQTYQYEGWRQ